MGKKESCQEKIHQLDRKLKFYQNSFLAIMTALVWSVYALIENKADSKIVILSGVGIVILLLISFRIKVLEDEQTILIDKLERID